MSGGWMSCLVNSILLAGVVVTCSELWRAIRTKRLHDKICRDRLTLEARIANARREQAIAVEGGAFLHPQQIGTINMRTSEMQNVAMLCLQLAASEQGGTPEQIIQRAETYLAFVCDGSAPERHPADSSDTKVK